MQLQGEQKMNAQRYFLRQAWAIFGPLKWRMLLVLGTIAVAQGLSLIGPYIQGTILDNISHQKAMSQTYWLIALACGIWLFTHWVLQFAREMYEVDKIDFDINERADDQTMIQVTSLSVGQHNSIHSGMKKSVIDRGQHSMTTLVHMFIYEIVPTISRATIMTVAMCWLSLSMGLIVLSAMAVFLALTIWMNQTFGPKLKGLEKKWNRESQFRGEILHHISHVLVNAQEEKAREEAGAKYDEVVTIAKPMWQRFLVWAYLKNMTLVLARTGIMALGAHYIYTGEYTFGKIVVFWGWSNDAMNSIGNVGSLQRQIIKMWTSIRRYCEFLGMETDVKVVDNPIVLDPIQGRIEVKNLSFAYDRRLNISEDEDDEASGKREKSKRPALRDVSLVIESGETVAIVGESGSGKTTLVSMLLRVSDPTAGQILIDGQDLKLLDLQAYRSKVGVVEQTVPLFDRSIRDNITYGLDGKASAVTEDELQRISDISQISRFSHKLEDGFNTLIGERGIKLSGGERQRVGIARARVKDRAIISFALNSRLSFKSTLISFASSTT